MSREASTRPRTLPHGWTQSALADIALVNPARIQFDVDDGTDVNFIPMRAVGSEGRGLVAPEIRRYSEVKKGYTSIRSGDVIMAKITPCMENGKTAVVPKSPRSACFGSTEFHVIRPEDGIAPSWIANFLLQHGIRREAQRAMTGGVGQMRVPALFLSTLCIPLAPAAEQKYICDALDELLSNVDAGVAALERARAKLALYRASVLKAAMDGTLTAEWRRDHPDVEPASELLKRILIERRRRWEEGQTAKTTAKGQIPPKNWKAKYSEPVIPDTVGLASLPEGWCWATVDQISDVGTGSTPNRSQRARYYDGGSVPWVTSGCVSTRIVRDPSGYVTPLALEDCNLTVYPPGTLLLAMYGEGRTRGMSAELGFASTTNQALAAIQTNAEVKSFLKVFLEKNYQDARRVASGGVQPNLNLGMVRRIVLPLPPIVEQKVIVDAIDDQLSGINHLEVDLEAKLKSSQSLRQSILRHAFMGALVPQDPNDEPASELLKRIAAERETRAREIGAPQAAVRPSRRRRTGRREHRR